VSRPFAVHRGAPARKPVRLDRPVPTVARVLLVLLVIAILVLLAALA
jgi:hypothetical protein